MATATPTSQLALHPYVVVNSLMTCPLQLTTLPSQLLCLRRHILWFSQKRWLLRPSRLPNPCGCLPTLVSTDPESGRGGYFVPIFRFALTKPQCLKPLHSSPFPFSPRCPIAVCATSQRQKTRTARLPTIALQSLYQDHWTSFGLNSLRESA